MKVKLTLFSTRFGKNDVFCNLNCLKGELCTSHNYAASLQVHHVHILFLGKCSKVKKSDNLVNIMM